jgi:nucleoid-associated protein YgaU
MKRKNLKKISILIMVVICLVSFPFFRKASGSNKIDNVKIVVYPGDTLWDIALKHRPNNTDVRKMVYYIRKANNLDTAIIQPGQELIIPIK